jgi:hypothetical protein
MVSNGTKNILPILLNRKNLLTMWKDNIEYRRLTPMTILTGFASSCRKQANAPQGPTRSAFDPAHPDVSGGHIKQDSNMVTYFSFVPPSWVIR